MSWIKLSPYHALGRTNHGKLDICLQVPAGKLYFKVPGLFGTDKYRGDEKNIVMNDQTASN
jgi:hypothetical protein